MTASIMTALNPVKRLNDAKNARIVSDAVVIDKAIRLYVADTGEKPIVGTPTYESGGGTVPICDTGVPTSSSCVNLDALIPQYLPALPEAPNAPAQTIGFVYSYAPGGEYLSVTPDSTVLVGSSSASSENPCDSLYSTDLATEITHEIDSRVAGLTANATTKNVFVTRGSATLPWVRSTTVWTTEGDAPLDVTGVSPWNSQLNYRKAGTLISPRHIVFANHYQIANGSTVIFIDADNNVVSRTLQSQQRVESTDIQVGILDADVPASISYYPVIAFSDVTQYLSPTTVPMLTFDQEDHAIIRDVSTMTNLYVFHTASPVGTERAAFNELLITGDSGDSAFFVIDDQLVLILTHYGASSGPEYGAYISTINQVMTNLGGGYQLTIVDLDCFVEP